MIKKSVFENDLIAGMQQELYKQASGEIPNLVEAGNCLHAALEIFEELGLTSQADQILSVLTKIAEDNQDAKGKPHKPKDPRKISDPHTKGLTPDKMVENLKHHGIVFNLADDGHADDLLDVELVDDNNLEISEENPSDKSFEDESDLRSVAQNLDWEAWKNEAESYLGEQRELFHNHVNEARHQFKNGMSPSEFAELARMLEDTRPLKELLLKL